MTEFDFELERRLDLWKQLAPHDDVEPQKLRTLRVYGGAQGVWVDKSLTAHGVFAPHGVTVGLLHTGRHYADELSSDGVIYHYPKTTRAGSRDLGEVEATKNALRHRLPVFVIMPGERSQSLRKIKLGWITDFDDENQQFLILFGGEYPNSYEPAAQTEAPFNLVGQKQTRDGVITVRPGQQKFRFQVMQKYGPKMCRLQCFTAGAFEGGSYTRKAGIR